MSGRPHTTTTGLIQYSETLLSLGFLGIVAIMLIPLPPFALDLLIAVNLCITILLLLIVLSVRRALELSVFPSLLLLLTLYRLSLNVASTRRILLSAQGGQLVAAFGSFVVGGNLVVGFVIFLILVIIQFIVITKGAGRISEVSARFTLDALPGKQLAIDADLNAGSINEATARERREELGLETEFYGAMDGASKFVRGDAVAGLIITAINLLGGVIQGSTHGMSLGESIETYSILTIGDGLVSQIPALIVATSAGILVTKTSSRESLGAEIHGQILDNDQPLWIGAGFMALLMLTPGLPKIPFLAMGAVLLLLLTYRKRHSRDAASQPPDPPADSQDESGLDEFLMTDRATIEVGSGLVSLVDPSHAKGLAERIRVLRKEFSQQQGIWIPPIRVQTSFEMPPSDYHIIIAGRQVASGSLRPEKKLAILPADSKVNLPGEDTQEPVFQLPSKWIEPSLSRQAEVHGHTVVDAGGVLVTHLSEILKRYGHELITRETLKEMIDRVQMFAPTIVEEIRSESLRMSLLHQVVRQLAAESVSLADFALILEAIANHAGQAKTPNELTDAVRGELGHLICKLYLSEDGRIRVIAFEPRVESRLRETLREGRLAIGHETLERIIESVTIHHKNSARIDKPLALVTDRSLRRPLRRLLSSAAPQLGIVSYQEIPEDMSLDPVAVITAAEMSWTETAFGDVPSQALPPTESAAPQAA